MGVALVLPPSSAPAGPPEPPLSIASLAGFLRAAGVEVVLDDLAARSASARGASRARASALSEPRRVVPWLAGRSRDRYLDLTAERLADLSPLDLSSARLVGVSAMGAEHLLPALALARALAGRGARVVLGGRAASTRARSLVERFPFVHAAVVGGGERALLELARGRPERAPGLVWRRGGDILSDPPAEVPLDELPPPDFEGLPEELYPRGFRCLPYQLSRGCPHGCAFCAYRLGWRPEPRSPRRAAEHLSLLMERLGAEDFAFVDNTLNVSPEFVAELCDALEPLGVRWSGYARPQGLDRALLRRMRRAGCAKLNLGVESGSQRVLDRLCKGLDASEAERVVREAHEAGIACDVDLIAGSPGEREEDVAASEALVGRLAPYMDSASVNVFTIPRGTEVSEHPERFGIARIRSRGEWADADDAFDEQGGPDWRERAEGRLRAAERLVAALQAGGVDVSQGSMANLLLLNQAELQRREGLCLHLGRVQDCYGCAHLVGDECEVGSLKSVPRMGGRRPLTRTRAGT